MVLSPFVCIFINDYPSLTRLGQSSLHGLIFFSPPAWDLLKMEMRLIHFGSLSAPSAASAMHPSITSLFYLFHNKWLKAYHVPGTAQTIRQQRSLPTWSLWLVGWRDKTILNTINYLNAIALNATKYQASCYEGFGNVEWGLNSIQDTGKAS